MQSRSCIFFSEQILILQKRSRSSILNETVFPFNQRLLKQKALWKKALTKYIWQNIQVFLLSLLLPLPSPHFLPFKGIVLFSILLLSHLGGHSCCFLQYISGNPAADKLQSKLRSRKATRRAKTSYCKSGKIWERSWSQSWGQLCGCRVRSLLVPYLTWGQVHHPLCHQQLCPPTQGLQALFAARSSTYLCAHSAGAAPQRGCC